MRINICKRPCHIKKLCFVSFCIKINKLKEVQVNQQLNGAKDGTLHLLTKKEFTEHWE